MSEDVTVDVEVEVEVDRDELAIERDDAELIEASYEAGGVEIEIEAAVEAHDGDADESDEVTEAGGDAQGEDE